MRDHPAGTQLHGLRDGPAPGRSRGRDVRRVEKSSRHHVRRAFPRPGHGRHRLRADHRKSCHATGFGVTEPGDGRHDAGGRRHRTRLARRLRAGSRGIRVQAHRRRRSRRGRQGDPAASVPPSRERPTGRDGVEIASLPQGTGSVHRNPRPHCRTPYCNAPIRHHDHATPDRDGGRTSAVNGLGLCEACNYAKEAPGWTVTTSVRAGEHRAEFVTPTHATYYSIAPPLPGTRISRRSIVEDRFSIDLVTFEAA